jgi:hypothetical protein
VHWRRDDNLVHLGRHADRLGECVNILPEIHLGELPSHALDVVRRDTFG